MKKNKIPKNQLRLEFEKTPAIFANKIIEEKIKKYIEPTHFKKDLNYQIRTYQEECIAKILESNQLKSSLIVYPAGTGKTFIAARIADKLIDEGKILVLAPRVSLAYQLTDKFKKYFDLPEQQICCLAAKNYQQRQKEYKIAKIIISTPQGIANDLKKLSTWPYKLLILDEVDFGVGDYDYVKIGKIAQKNNTPILGLSATVGKMDKLKQLLQTFNFQKVFIKLDYEKDIKPYRRRIITNKKFCEFEEPYKKMYNIVDSIYKECLERISQKIYIEDILQKKYISIEDIQEIGNRMEGKIYLISDYAELLNLYELRRIILEESKQQILKKIKELIEKEKEGKRYAKNILQSIKNTEFAIFYKKSKTSTKIKTFLDDLAAEKENIKRQNSQFKAIVVCTSREFAEFVKKVVEKNEHKAALYLGKRENFTKSKQLSVLERFLNSDLELIVCTRSSIERGIDLPNADFLFLLNPHGSEKSNIQLLNRINRSNNRQDAKIFVYYQGEHEYIKDIIAVSKTRSYYSFLSNFKKLLELEEQKLPDNRKTPLQILEELSKQEKNKK